MFQGNAPTQWILGFTALFKNMQTLKFKSYLHTGTFCCSQSYKDHKQWTLKHRNTTNGWNPPITNHKLWLFEPVTVKRCFLRGPLRRLIVAKNANVSWLLNFKICVSEKHSKGLAFSSGFEKRQVQLSGMTSFSAGQVTVEAHLHWSHPPTKSFSKTSK